MNRHTVERFRHKLDHMKASDYHGLKSPGLTCYLNSILQVLFMTPEFRETVKSTKGPTSMDLHLRELFADLEKGAADTQRITELLRIKDVFQQQDAAEFFQKILTVCSSEAAEIFKGELSYKLTCCSCSQETDSRNHFHLLPLAVGSWHHEPYSVAPEPYSVAPEPYSVAPEPYSVAPEPYSVSKGFEAFFQRDTVSRENRMYCNPCRGKKDATFQCQITKHPDILTLLLKRFSFDLETNRYVKVSCDPDVPETLQTQDLTYELYAVVMHSGSLAGGHYTAGIKSFENDEWYDFNDARVKRVAVGNECRRSEAYLLMYKKVSRQSERLCLGGAPGPSSSDLPDRTHRGAIACRHGRTADRHEGRASLKPTTTLLDHDRPGREVGINPRMISGRNLSTQTIRATTNTLIHTHAGPEGRTPQEGGRDPKGKQQPWGGISNRQKEE